MHFRIVSISLLLTETCCRSLQKDASCILLFLPNASFCVFFSEKNVRNIEWVPTWVLNDNLWYFLQTAYHEESNCSFGPQLCGNIVPNIFHCIQFLKSIERNDFFVVEYENQSLSVELMLENKTIWVGPAALTSADQC